MKKTLYLIAIFLVLSGCSSVKLSYGFLDNWIGWKVDDYVTLKPEQKQQFNSAVDEFHRWHRQTQLPLYAAFIDDFSGFIEQEILPPETLSSGADTARELWQQSALQLLPTGIALLQGLDQNQQAEIRENIAKEEAKDNKEFFDIPIAERKQRRLEKTQAQFKKWLGTLSTSQKNRINLWIDTIYFINEERQEKNTIWQDAFFTLIQNPQARYFSDSATELLTDASTLWPPSYREKFEFNKTATVAMLSDIHQTLSVRQKRQVIKKLRRYQRDFTALTNNTAT